MYKDPDINCLSALGVYFEIKFYSNDSENVFDIQVMINELPKQDLVVLFIDNLT